MANDKNFKIKNGLSAKRYLQNSGVDTAGSNGPFGVFSTTLYTGTSSAQTITNGIDLANDGGLVWAKSRSTRNHILSDTERGTGKVLFSNLNIAEDADATTITSYNSDGFTMGSSTLKMNTSGENFVSWTFKKQAKFFDVVTYTGDGVSGLTVNHSLGGTVGSMFVKCTSHADDWYVYHIETGATHSSFLNTSAAAAANGAYWNNTAPTTTQFTVGDNAGVNANGRTYVAYLFAHDTASDSDIKCGSYTGNGSATGPEINLGWEPSWLMVKAASSSGDWWIVDSVRGVVDGGNDPRLLPSASDPEASSNYVKFTSTGFQPEANFGIVNGSGITYIYMAIRAVVPTQTLDLSTGHTFSFTPSAATDILFSNPPASGNATGFSVEVNNSGGYALTWPSSVKWPSGTAPTATASKEVYAFVTTDGGTSYYGKLAGSDIA
jgi:hypothetical protein